VCLTRRPTPLSTHPAWRLLTHQPPDCASPPRSRNSSVVAIAPTCSRVHRCITMSFPPPPKAADEHDIHDDTAMDPRTEVVIKSGAKPEASLNVTFGGGVRSASPDPSLLSIDDSNNIRLGRRPAYLPVGSLGRHVSLSPAPRPQTWRGRSALFWTRNKGLAYVLFSQLFGTLMNVTTRMLEIEGNDGM
jgi:hypothetical protein